MRDLTGAEIGRGDNHVALMRALLAAGDAPAFRTYRFDPPCVVVGYHQCVDLEVRRDRCAALGIDVVRRPTGGGAVYIDSRQIVWEVFAPSVQNPHAFLAETTARVARAVGHGVRARGRNDLERNGRKVGGIAAASDGPRVLVHGTILVDADFDRMFDVLVAPGERAAVRDRVTSLGGPTIDEVRAALRAEFRPVPGALTPAEETALAKAAPLEDVPMPAGPDVGRAAVRADGGVVQAVVRLYPDGDRLRTVLFAGDYFAYPMRAVWNLEAALRDARVGDVPRLISERWSAEVPGFTPADFARAAREAIANAHRAVRAGV